MPTDEEKQAYREAYDGWHRQLEALHAFLLEGERPRNPDAVKGLFNREERAKRRYDLARLRLLGLESTVDLGSESIEAGLDDEAAEDGA